jgi:O-antigen/teichoic acid export membrane protein
LLLLIPTISFLIVMGREFLVLWVGSDFADLGTILAVLALGRFFMAAQYSNFLVLVGKGEHKVFGVMAVSVALSAVVLGVGFVGVLKWGVMGMAVANTAPMILIYGVIMPVYYNRRMSISKMELVRFVFGPAVAGCAPAIVAIGLWKLLAPPGSWSQLGMVIVSVALVWALSVWRLSLNRVERARFLSMLSARANRQNNSAGKEEG